MLATDFATFCRWAYSRANDTLPPFSDRIERALRRAELRHGKAWSIEKLRRRLR